MNKLMSIPGVGAKTAAKLVEYFGSEEEALGIIENLDLYSLATSGIGMRSALNIALAYLSKKLGVSPEDVLSTEDAKTLYQAALDLYKSKVVNPITRNRFDLLYPLPSSKLDVIMDRVELSRQAVQLVNSLSRSDLSKIEEALASIQPIPRPTKLRVDRTIIVESKDDYARLIEMGVNRYCRTFMLEENESLHEHLESEEHIILILKRSLYDLDLENEFVEVYHKVPSLTELVPELITQVFAQNIKTIRALEVLSKSLEGFPALPAIEKIRSRISYEALSRVFEAVNELCENPSSSEGKDVARLERSIAKIDSVVRDLEIALNSDIERFLSTYEARVSGETIAELLREASASSISSSKLMAVIPGEVLDRIRSMIHQAGRSLKDTLSLDGVEAEWIEGIFPDLVSLPVEVSEKAVDRLKLNLSRKLISLRFKVLSNIAHKLEPLVDLFRDAYSAAFELDAFLAIGKIGSSKGFSISKVEGSEIGIWFKDGTNTSLLALEPLTPIQRVSYGIGSGSKHVGGSSERVVLLTGANSGGKTMLLSTIAQIAILAQSGLPVQAAEATVFPVDKIFFFSRPAGIKDAGAFESALTGLVEVASTKSSKLILVDEFEAATEPGAAARVLASVIEILAGQERSLVVVVTHLAQQILSSTSIPVRVDGIEAKGLNANYNLMVDRSPKINYLARSTPELIVEKLLHKSSEPIKQIYEKILEKIRSTK
ncbi:MAG: MutS-related protein [Thermoproteota archaeon]